jgi:hypothetical protein
MHTQRQKSHDKAKQKPDLRHANCRNATRLRANQIGGDTATAVNHGVEQILRHLRALAATGLARYDDHLAEKQC